MKKKDIIQLVKNVVKENTFYGNREQPSQLSTGTKVSVPTDEYPFSAKPKRTATGMMEFQQPKSFDPDTLALVREMLNDADIHHNELVGGYDEVSSYLDKRTGGTIIKIPHFNGPGGRGALFGKETTDKIDRSKAAAKTVAAKLYYKFKTYIEDYEISDKSPAGVYGNIYLWMMFNDLAKDYSAPKGGTQSSQLEMHDFEKKYGDKIDADNFKNNPKLQPGKTVKYLGTSRKIVKNNGFVLTLDNGTKINLGQFNQKGAIKEKDMENIKQEGIAVKLKTQSGTPIPQVFATQKDALDFATGASNLQNTVEPYKENEMNQISLTNNTIEELDVLVKKHGAKEAIKAVIGRIKALENQPLNNNPKLKPEEMDINEMINDYIKERGDDNLKEHVDKYHKRTQLMEGAIDKIFKLFKTGLTPEQVRGHYFDNYKIDMPIAFAEKVEKHYNDLRKSKLDLQILDKEAESLEKIQPKSISGMEDADVGMEEDKQLTSGLFNETK